MEGSSHEARLVQMWTHGSFFSRLAEARTGRYGHATRHLQTCALLSKRIDAWGDIRNHQAYMAAIRSGHGRKSAFWMRMQELPLP